MLKPTSLSYFFLMQGFLHARDLKAELPARPLELKIEVYIPSYLSENSSLRRQLDWLPWDTFDVYASNRV